MSIHLNSLFSYRTLDLAASQKRVCDALERIGRPATDREVASEMGCADMNGARPRLTELVDSGVLVEVRSVRCPVTGRPVRQTWFA